MQAVPIPPGQQQFWIHAVLHHVRRAPLAGHRDVVSQMPGEVVGKVLRTALDLPPSQWLEGVVIEGKDSARAIAVGRTESAYVDAVGAAVQSVGTAVAGSVCKRFRLDYFYDLRLLGVGLGVENVNARRTQTGNNQISSLHMRMRSIRTKRGTAGI